MSLCAKIRAGRTFCGTSIFSRYKALSFSRLLRRYPLRFTVNRLGFPSLPQVSRAGWTGHMKNNRDFPLVTMIATLTAMLATVSSLAAGSTPALVITTSGSGSGWAWISIIVGILAGGGLIAG